jgi:CO/xanthine dehydrogenase FAD-binding subunit
MLTVQIAPDAEVWIESETLDGVLSTEQFHELMDTALQLDEVAERVYLHPRFLKASLDAYIRPRLAA